MNNGLEIVRVGEDNYKLFDDMVFIRMNGREKNVDELKQNKGYTEVNKALQNENLFIYAARCDNKFVGWISVIYLPKVGRTNGRGLMYIDELYVAPEYRGRGFAKELMKKADERSDLLNALGIRLFVDMENESAINVYKKCGYIEEGKTYFMEKE